MDVLEKFKDLFIDVWTDGIAGVNISEILIAVVIFFFFLFLRGCLLYTSDAADE